MNDSSLQFKSDACVINNRVSRVARGGNNQLVSYIDYDYYIIITNIIRIKVQIILY